MQSRQSLVLAAIRQIPVIPRILVIGVISILATFIIVGVLSTILDLMYFLLTSFSLWFTIPMIFVIGKVLGSHKGGLNRAMMGVFAIVLAFAAVWALSCIVQLANDFIRMRIPVFVASMAVLAAAVHAEDIKHLTMEDKPVGERIEEDAQ